MSALLNAAAVIPAPTKDDLEIVDVGITATTEADLLAQFGMVSSAGDTPKGPVGFKITVIAEAEAYIVFGAAGLDAPIAAATSAVTPDGRAARLAAGVPRSFDVREKTRYYRAIALAANTRIEIAFG